MMIRTDLCFTTTMGVGGMGWGEVRWMVCGLWMFVMYLNSGTGQSSSSLLWKNWSVTLTNFSFLLRLPFFCNFTPSSTWHPGPICGNSLSVLTLLDLGC